MKIPAKWLYPLIALVLYSLGGFLLAPWLVERTLISTASDMLGVQTEVDDVSINPFTLTLRVDGLALKEADGSELFRFDSLFINFETVSLFRWAWSFDEVHLTRPIVHIERFSETDSNLARLGERFANRSSDDSSPDEAGSESGTQPDDANETSLPRAVVADLKIIGGAIELVDNVPAERFSTQFTPIDISVANLSTLVESSGNQTATITTESGAQLAWTGALTINPFEISGQVTLDGTYTPMLSRYFKEPLPVSLQGGHMDGQFNYIIADDGAGNLAVRLYEVQGTLDQLAVRQVDDTILAEINTLGFAGGELNWPAMTVHLDELRMELATVDLVRQPNGSYLAGVEGTSPAPNEPTPPDESSAAISPATSGSVGWQVSVDDITLRDSQIRHTDMTLESAPELGVSLELTLSHVTNATNEPIGIDAVAEIAAGGTIMLNATAIADNGITLESKIQVADLALNIAQPYLAEFANIQISDGTTSLNGTLVSNPNLPFEYQGDLRVENLALLDAAQGESLLSWTNLTLDQFALNQGALNVSELSLLEPYARIEIERDGSTNVTRTLVTPPTAQTNNARANDAETAADARDADETAPFEIIIGKTNIADATAHFTDLALPLPFEANISALNGSISTLASNSQEAARVALEGQVNEYGELSINGKLQPFAIDADTDIAISFLNVNMPRMSPYTIKFAGRKITEGRTDLQIDYKITDGALNGANRLVIHDLLLGENVDQPGAMNLPLDLAVALLRDPAGKIDLDFPVTGELDNPEFSYSGAIGKAFSNIILSLATSPFRLLGGLVGLKPEELESVAFRPGRSDLTPPQRETLNRLAEALVLRPQLRLEIPAVYDPQADRMMLQTLTTDTQIDQLLEQSAGEADAAPLTERRQTIIESLYDQAQASGAIIASLQEIRSANSQPDATGTVALDSLAYVEAMREALIAATSVSDSDMQTLAADRVRSIITSLSATDSLDASRFARIDAIESAMNDDGQIVMPLTLATTDSPNLDGPADSDPESGDPK